MPPDVRINYPRVYNKVVLRAIIVQSINRVLTFFYLLGRTYSSIEVLYCTAVVLDYYYVYCVLLYVDENKHLKLILSESHVSSIFPLSTQVMMLIFRLINVRRNILDYKSL